MSSNVSGQTLLTLIEVNRESLSESLPLVLKREYGCHRRDMRRTELCLSEQLETSASASEIIVVRILNQRVTVFGCHIDAAEQQRVLNFESLVSN